MLPGQKADPVPPALRQVSPSAQPSPSGGLSAEDSQDLLGASATAMLKAFRPGAGGSSNQPTAARHYAAEVARRQNLLSNGILEDQTPHLDPPVLRALARRVPIISGIDKTLTNQIARNFHKPLTEKSLGAKVVLKERKKSVSRAEAQQIQYITDILFKGGIEWDHPTSGERGVWDAHGDVAGMTLDLAIRALCRDSLTMDRMAIEIEPSGGYGNGGKPKHPVAFWRPVDAALMKKVDVREYVPQVNPRLSKGQCKYVMLEPEDFFSVMREYGPNEAAMGFRNPRTDFLSFGYGEAETELCLSAILGLLYALQANTDYFTKNHIPQGVLTVFGNFGRQELENLKGQFSQEVGYPGGGFWEFPMLSAMPQAGSSVEWTPLVDRTRQDMLFEKLANFCVALVCSVKQIAPEEISFASFGGPDAALSKGGDKDKTDHSQSKGLLPKILFLCAFLSKHVVERINPDCELVVNGLEAAYSEEQMEKAEYELKLMEQGYSLNMIRARNDEPPVIDPLDPGLWRRVELEYANKYYYSETERILAMIERYEDLGGQQGDWPNAPANSAGSIQIWMAQHQGEQGQAQQDMSQIGNAEADAQRQREDQERQEALGQMGQAQGAQDQQDLAERTEAGQQMGALQSASDQRQSEEDAANREASQAGEMRVPMPQDAAYDRPKPPKKGRLGKSATPDLVIRIGRRDDP